MQERVLLEPDIDERGLEAVFEVPDFALEHAADQALFGRALDGEFLEPAVFEHGDAGFERLGVDDDFLVDAFDRFDEALHFLDQTCWQPTRMVSTMPFGCSLTGTGSKTFSSSTSAGVSRLGSRNSLLAAPGVAGASGGKPSAGNPAAMFSARSISCA